MMVPRKGLISRVRTPLVRVAAWLLSLKTPTDASDLRVTVDAEGKLAFRGRLHEITVPTLIGGGTEDSFYSAECSVRLRPVSRMPGLRCSKARAMRCSARTSNGKC